MTKPNNSDPRQAGEASWPGAPREAWTPAPLPRDARGLSPIGQVLVRTHEAMHQKTGALMTTEDWRAIVGDRIGARTRVGALVKGELIVNVASSAWAQELGFLSEDILRRLRAVGRDVKRLKLRVEPLLGGSAPPPRRLWPRGDAPAIPRSPERELPPELLEKVAHVEDPHLRAAIAEAIVRTLGRGGSR